MKKIVLLAAFAMMAMAMSAQVMLDVYVSDDTQPTNYRDAPKGDIVGQLENGDMISVDKSQNGWFRIMGSTYYNGEGDFTYRYKGEKWIHSSVVTVSWMQDGSVNFALRSTPSKKGKVVHRGYANKWVDGNFITHVLDFNKNWVKISLKNGKVGWVERNLVCGNSLTVCM